MIRPVLAFATLVLVGCGSRIVESPRPAGEASEKIVDDAGKACFNVVILGTKEEVKRLREGLGRACSALRDPELKAYLVKHAKECTVKPADFARLGDPNKAFDRILEPSEELHDGADQRGPVDFYVKSAGSGTPGTTDLSLGPEIRAIQINSTLRLRGVSVDDKSHLVNTLAHETLHLHYVPPKVVTPIARASTISIFRDGGDDVQQCHSLSYIVGNAAGCSYLRGKQPWSDAVWHNCMADQASLTPGGQKKPNAKRNAFGCD